MIGHKECLCVLAIWFRTSTGIPSSASESPCIASVVTCGGARRTRITYSEDGNASRRRRVALSRKLRDAKNARKSSNAPRIATSSSDFGSENVRRKLAGACCPLGRNRAGPRPTTERPYRMANDSRWPSIGSECDGMEEKGASGVERRGLCHRCSWPAQWFMSLSSMSTE
ncbi:hypothetical protein GSI_04337 [Ganoderma sinense ZZ0214-1]|uniref:Transcription factor n=1 Tax=Ganoderma sinense ZZ0214-1 TaxID=1077348 RepID=A0A2G8SIW8_9APHY|nr:hypothetical protein GSI_04337 [Ganoderma sinense ZZ0214-1]